MRIEVKFQELYRLMPRSLYTKKQTQDLGSHLLIGNTRAWGCKAGFWRQKPAGVTLGMYLATASCWLSKYLYIHTFEGTFAFSGYQVSALALVKTHSTSRQQEPMWLERGHVFRNTSVTLFCKHTPTRSSMDRSEAVSRVQFSSWIFRVFKVSRPHQGRQRKRGRKGNRVPKNLKCTSFEKFLQWCQDKWLIPGPIFVEFLLEK